MNMLLEELARVAGNPLSWGAVAVLAAFAVYSVWHWRTCPLLRVGPNVTHTEAEAALNRPIAEGVRFLGLMLAGIALTLTALSFISLGIYPVVAFYMLLTGLFVIQTEPARRQIREAELRVVAAECQTEDVQEAALAQLRSGHQWLLTINFLLLLAAAVALLAF